MKQETVQYLSDQEEEFVNILIGIGTKKNVAKVLVFLKNSAKGTLRAIERGTDLRQPQVSVALRYMAGQGWVKISKIPSERKGRQNKQFALAVPLPQIMDGIEKITRERAENQLALVRKMRNFV